MGTPYIGEIRLIGCNYAPYGWALCQGQLESIANYEALYNLIGTTYGGDGQNTFGLPDLRGRVPMHIGTFAGNTYVMGQLGGAEQVTLTAATTALHNHQVNATTTGQRTAPSTQAFPASATPTNAYVYGPPGGSSVQMYGGIIGPGQSGGSQPHENRQPFLVVNFIIALQGAYPSQN